MEPALATNFPAIKTFAGRSVSNPNISLRFDYSPQGFNAIVHTGNSTALIVPNSPEEQVYLSFWLKDVDFSTPEAQQFHCEVKHTDAEIAAFSESFVPTTNNRAAAPVDLYTYRLAVATTAEYSDDYGDTPSSVLANVVTVVNNVNSVFERDAAVRMVLVANTEQVFHYSNPDPYTNGNTEDMINENPAVLNAAFSVNGYDIGHVFGTNGGGLANLAGVCNSEGGLAQYPKARAASCKFGPYDGPLFYIIAGHEMGHQFNATHTFNSCDNDNETPETGYEPGSGSTIMCYNGNGVCGTNHVQPTSDAFFHVNSMLRIQTFTRTQGGSTCKQVIAEGNEMPVADIPMEGGFFIPKSTPFKLTGSATDVNDPNTMTYTWEQYDLGPWSALGSPITSAPLFRWYPPTTSTTRIFPRIETIVANANDIREVLPTIDRELTFRFVVRDNHTDAGAFNFDEIKFNCKASAGPFLVTYPNAAETFAVGDAVTVTWDVANTNLSPVNCQKVNLHLSTDGGLTYPTLLVADVDNDGTAYVVMPNMPTTTARIRVEAADNIFFDISNQNFTITAATQPGYILTTSPSQGGLACDEISFNLQTSVLDGYNGQVTFSLTAPPAGIGASFNPTTVTAGQSSTLTLNTSGVQPGEYNITLLATSPGLPDQTRSLVVTIVDTDLSGINATAPVDGAASQGTLPSFAWTDLPNATNYEIQIATDPGFTQIVDSNSDLNLAEYTPSITLEDGTVYYWRVRGINPCGTGSFGDPFSFRTIQQTCITKASAGDQNGIIIPSAGLPSISSKINIPQAGIISDVNITKVKGNHTTIRYIEMRLKGPDNTSVVLLSGPSCNGSNFDCKFSDQTLLELVNCPQTNVEYKPVGTLSDFNGKNSQGDWTMELEVIDSDGEGGKLDNWEMEVCAGLSSANPVVIKNDTLGVPPAGTNRIYLPNLVVTDADNLPAELEFTIVTNTAHGQVKLGNQVLGVGGHFTMQDIINNSLTYTNTNAAALFDYFTFSVNDGEGGYTGTPRFNLKMDADAEIIDGVNILGANAEIFLHPNPASDVLNVVLGNSVGKAMSATLLDVQGRLVPTTVEGIGSQNLQINVGNVLPGLYLLHVNTGNGIAIKKVVID